MTLTSFQSEGVGDDADGAECHAGGGYHRVEKEAVDGIQDSGSDRNSQDVVEEGTGTMFTGLNNVKFRSPVKPGDTFESKCEIIKAKPPFYFAKGEGRVDGKVAVKAEFSFVLVKE